MRPARQIYRLYFRLDLLTSTKFLQPKSLPYRFINNRAGRVECRLTIIVCRRILINSQELTIKSEKKVRIWE